MSSHPEANGTLAQGTNQDAKITVYWLESSRAQRVLVLLEELKLTYEIRTFKRSKDGLAPPELKDVHPLGKSPVVVIEVPGGEKPLVLAETGAIFEYLVDYWGGWLVPQKAAPGNEGKIGKENDAWLRNRYFMHYAEGSLMGLLAVGVVMLNIKNAPVPFFIKPITRMIYSKIAEGFLEPNYASHLGFLESQLKTSPDGGEYLCGKELTEADLMMIFPLEGSKAWAGLDEKKYPLLCRYLDKIKERESYKRAEKRVMDVEGSFKPVF